MLTHLPSRRSLTASDLSCRAMASRQTPAKVDGTVDSSWPGETLASAAEDTGKRSPSMGQRYGPKLPDRERAEHRLHPLRGKIQPDVQRIHPCIFGLLAIRARSDKSPLPDT